MMLDKKLSLPKLDALQFGAHRLYLLTDNRLFDEFGIRVAFATRFGGVSKDEFESLNLSHYVGDKQSNVLDNRHILCESLGLDSEKIVFLNQVHGTDIITIENDNDYKSFQSADEHQADGLLIGMADISTMLFGSDCPLVAVVSPSGKFVAFHSGWRGTIAGIAGKAALELSERDDYPISSYNAYIGPHICPDCFETSIEIANQFVSRFGKKCVPDARHVSLEHAIISNLLEVGLEDSHIISAGKNECTNCNPDKYFSYRASGGKCGRHALICAKI